MRRSSSWGATGLAGASGEPAWVKGTVRGVGGELLPGARIEVWEADDEGLYDVQHADAEVNGRVHLFTDADGGYRFWGLYSTPYPIPDDGPVGELLAATGRSPYRAAHLHFMVTAPGYRTLVTHIFVRGDSLLDADSVFGVKGLAGPDWIRHSSDEPAPNRVDLHGSPWWSTQFNIVLAAGDSADHSALMR